MDQIKLAIYFFRFSTNLSKVSQILSTATASKSLKVHILTAKNWQRTAWYNKCCHFLPMPRCSDTNSSNYSKKNNWQEPILMKQKPRKLSKSYKWLIAGKYLHDHPQNMWVRRHRTEWTIVAATAESKSEKQKKNLIKNPFILGLLLLFFSMEL